MLEQFASLLFLEFVFGGDEAEQLTIATVFHDEEEFVWRLNGLIQLDDVGMADDFENVNFARDALYIVDIGDLAFVEDLDGHFLVGQHVYALLNFTEGALTERFCYSV